MRMSADARALRKQAHLVRLERRGDPDYPVLYAKQPVEVRKAAEQGAQRKALRAAKVQLELLMGADARGSAAIFAGVPVGEIETPTVSAENSDAAAAARSMGT